MNVGRGTPEGYRSQQRASEGRRRSALLRRTSAKEGRLVGSHDPGGVAVRLRSFTIGVRRKIVGAGGECPRRSRARRLRSSAAPLR